MEQEPVLPREVEERQTNSSAGSSYEEMSECELQAERKRRRKIK